MRSILAASLVVMFLPGDVPAQGFKVPDGFEVREFADEKLANDIHCLTIDPKGRVVVAGRGYIRILIDDNHDGKADRALEFASTPKDGAMGLLWEGDSLYVTGDGGLRRFTSKSGDKADGPSTLLRAMKTGGEHSSHAIRRGPDGWLYVLCGNNAEIDKSYAELPTSPIKDPIAGCVLRFFPSPLRLVGQAFQPDSQAGKPDLREGPGVRGCEIVAHGFRNPYGMDFNLEGDLFTYDSDNERCVSLPWYEPTRFYHVIEGRHYGWLNPQHAVTWRRPAHFCDVVAPAATLGRGSPTGVACYRHNQFPPKYQGGFFLCDWTFGKIYHVTLDRKGATYTGTPRVFLEAVGTNGFAPTACAVHEKTGDLYVGIGGRGTRGAVYRIRHTERFNSMQGKLAPLPMRLRSLEWNDSTRKEYETKLWSKSAAEHLRALQIARRQGSFLEEKGVSSPFDTREYFDDISVRLAYADLMEDLLAKIPPRLAEAFVKILKNNVQLPQSMAYGMGILNYDRLATLERGLFILNRSKIPERRLEGTRLIQLALGDLGSRKTIGTIWEGYTPRLEITDESTVKRFTPKFPSGDDMLDRELARTFGMLGADDVALRKNLLAKCDGDSGPLDDIHYLACYARLGGKRQAKETEQVARTLLDLDRKIAERKLNRDANWPLRVRELYVGLAEKDASLPRRLAEDASFGRPDHALFANTQGFDKQKAARIFLKRWQADSRLALNGDIVGLFAALPVDEVVPTIRKRWGSTGYEAALVPILAKKPEPGDRGKFVEGLDSPQAPIVVACLEGLTALGVKADGPELLNLIRALQRTPEKQVALRTLLADALQARTTQKLGSDSKQWIAWFSKAHPELATRLENPDGVDIAKWQKRLASLDWSTGNADRGKSAYAKAQCAQCHSGSQALGPDLTGVSKRFSRDDILTSILQPSRDVPARYQMSVVETRDGKTFSGIVIYDAVDSLILQTGAATTVRLDGAAIVSRSVSTQSLMPAGLLDALSDQEIADLLAYLQRQ